MRFCGTGMVSQTRSGCCWECWEEVAGGAETAADGRRGRGRRGKGCEREGEDGGEQGLLVVGMIELIVVGVGVGGVEQPAARVRVKLAPASGLG